jgi:hypothetical protein
VNPVLGLSVLLVVVLADDIAPIHRVRPDPFRSLFPAEGPLPLGRYPLVAGDSPGPAATFRLRSWQQEWGVIVTLDGNRIPNSWAADTKLGYVELIRWDAVDLEKGLPGWRLHRAVGKVSIRFADDRPGARAAYLQWLKSKPRPLTIPGFAD